MSDDDVCEKMSEAVWNEYLKASDQSLSSLIYLNYDASSGWCGGMMVQSLGHASSSVQPEQLDSKQDAAAVNKLESEWEKMHHHDGKFRTLADSVGLEKCLTKFVGEVLGRPSVEDVRVYSCDFHCRCTRNQFIGKLVALPDADLASLLADENDLVLACNNCNEKYEVSRDSLQKILDGRIQAGSP